MKFLQHQLALLSAAWRQWNQDIEDWQARNRARTYSKEPGAEPTPWLFLVAVIVVIFTVIFLLGQLASLSNGAGDYPQRIHAPASGPQIIAQIIGYTIIFGPIVALIFVFVGITCGTAYDADKSRHQRQVAAWKAEQSAQQQAEFRRQQDASEVQRRRDETRRQAHAETIRLQNVRLEIALTEERVKNLEAENNAVDAKIRKDGK